MYVRWMRSSSGIHKTIQTFGKVRGQSGNIVMLNYSGIFHARSPRHPALSFIELTLNSTFSVRFTPFLISWIHYFPNVFECNSASVYHLNCPLLGVRICPFHLQDEFGRNFIFFFSLAFAHWHTHCSNVSITVSSYKNHVDDQHDDDKSPAPSHPISRWQGRRSTSRIQPIQLSTCQRPHDMAEKTTRRPLGFHRKREHLNKTVSKSSNSTGHNRFRKFPTT